MTPAPSHVTLFSTKAEREKGNIMNFAAPDIYVLTNNGHTDYFQSFDCVHDVLMDIAAGNLEDKATDNAIVDMFWVERLSESDLTNRVPFVLRTGDVQVMGEYFSD